MSNHTPDINYEYRRNTKRSGPVMLKDYEDIQGRSGYISCYGFPKETSELIEEQKATYGLAELPLYSDLLYIDVDDDNATAWNIQAEIQRLGLTYSMFASGSPDSYHFHLPTVPQTMVGLPSLHLLWMKQTFGKDANVDFSIYKTSGIIKIAGAPHKKHPGAIKEFLRENTMDTLDLTDFSVKYEPMLIKERDSSLTEDSKADILDMWLNQACEEGGRNIALYKRCVMAADLGLDKYAIEDLMRRWNNIWCYPPISEREMLSTINSATRR